MEMINGLYQVDNLPYILLLIKKVVAVKCVGRALFYSFWVGGDIGVRKKEFNTAMRKKCIPWLVCIEKSGNFVGLEKE